MAADTLRSIRFNSLNSGHLPQVLALEQQVQSAPWSEMSFRNEIDHPNGIFLVAEISGKVVAYGGVWLVVDEAHVTTLSVDPELRRQGVATRLMTEILERAKERGATCSTLEVRAGNTAAISLYESLGYCRAGLRRRYYPDNREDAVIMWLYHLDTWEAPPPKSRRSGG